MTSAAPVAKDRSRYEEKNLGFLLLAMGLPAALLYLRILLGTVADYSRSLTSSQLGRLTLLSNLALAAFILVQILCAAFIQRLVPARCTRGGRLLQYAAVLLLCVLLSVTGAVLFEAFGVTLLIRSGNR